MNLSDELPSRPDTDAAGRGETVGARCQRAAGLVFDGRYYELGICYQRPGALDVARAGTRAASLLYVEDNPLVAAAVKGALEAEGWRVEVCARGAEGLSVLEAGRHYDLLVLDNELPDISGVEIARRARRLPHRAGVPVVVLSAAGSEAEARRGESVVFLRKPEGVAALVRTVRRLLDGKL